MLKIIREIFPGKYVILARKSKDNWYVEGINGEETARNVTLDLSVLGKPAGGRLITDGENSREFSTREFDGEEISLSIKPHGGFVIVLNTE